MNEGATAEAVTTKIHDALKEFDVDYKNVSVLLAMVMVGRENGVAVRLTRDCPSMVAVHCVAHRLALACSQAAKAFPEQGRYKRTLISFYSYFSLSSKRVYSLREIQAVLEDPQIQARPLYDVRWLSFFNAVSAVRRTFKSLIVFFDEEAAEYNDPVAKGLMKQVSSYSFLAITHMLYDVLSQLTRLSKVFQKDLLEFSVI